MPATIPSPRQSPDHATVDAVQSSAKLFLAGPFGAGKTTLAVARARWLLSRERIRGDDILVLVPQRTLGRPYQEALRQPHIPPGPPVRVMTVAGLARQSVELYWPLLAEAGGFADPGQEPTFLNLETSQYHMARFVDAALDQGDFDGIRVEHSRIVSQVLDNLNKAALHGFDIDEAYARLELAVPGGEQRTARLNALRAARRISHQYRAHCLARSLVDFSLWIQLFNRQVLSNPWSRTHLFRTYRHLIVDNVEEDTSTAHRLIAQWLPHMESALIIADDDGGYRIFLGADPEGVADLADACDRQVQLTHSHVSPPVLQELQRRVTVAVYGRRATQKDGEQGSRGAGEQGSGEAGEQGSRGAGERGSGGAGEPQPATRPPPPAPHHSPLATRTAFHVPDRPHRFYPQMIDWAVKTVCRLVQDEGIVPGQIAVLAPFVSDALRFSLQTRLGELDIPSTTHRPSRALKAEPAARCLMTLAALAHPYWQLYPTPADVALTLGLTIECLDPVRAHLLTRAVYPPHGQAVELRKFESLKSAVQQRITFRAGEAYRHLRNWIYAYRADTAGTPVDQFFARIFGEVLSQPDYGFHQDLDAARVAHQLVESARNFRWAVESSDHGQNDAMVLGTHYVIGRSYLELVESGALGALHVPGWREDESAVFIAPAYTFLMRNRPVDVQIWLDIGATGWWERLYQPLTHPYVLSQRWPPQAPWSDFEEYQRRQEMLRRLLLGLIRRTRRYIFLGMSDYGESGMEQRGPLLGLINNILTQERAAAVPA